MTRTVIRQDAACTVYEVRDDDGNVIGTDEVFTEAL